MSPLSSESDHEEVPSLLSLTQRGETGNPPRSVASDDSEDEAPGVEKVAPMPQREVESAQGEDEVLWAEAAPAPADGNIVISTQAPTIDSVLEASVGVEEDEDVKKMRRRLRELIRLATIADEAAQRSKLRWIDGACSPRP